VLEHQFPETAETQPELLAHHYTEAGRHEQAVHHWLHAGRRAAARSANAEAVAHLTEGLAVCKRRPEAPERTQHEFDLQFNLGLALRATHGYAAPEVAAAFDQARHLCEQVGDTTQRFRVLCLLATIYGNQAAMQAWREVTEQCMDIARSQPDLEFTLEGHRLLGVILFWQGEFTQARVHFKQIMTLYNRTQHGSHALLYGQDVAVVSLAYLKFTSMDAWLSGPSPDTHT
jgi:predicted ATPase